MRAVQALSRKRRRHNLAGKDLAECRHVIGGPRSNLTDRGNAAQQFIQRLEVGSQFRVKIGEQRRAQQFAGGIVMAFLK